MQAWETKLSQEAVLYTESGMPVWVDRAAPIVDRSRNRRHDFSSQEDQAAGVADNREVSAEGEVQDQQAKRVAEQTMSGGIVAQMETRRGNNRAVLRIPP